VSSLENEIARSSANVFRRAFIKRRQSADGKFEASFTSITPLVKSWGSIETAVDDTRLNFFRHSGFTLKAINDFGDFNVETDNNSLWNGFLTRYRSLVKVEAGYTADDATEFPTDPTLGIFILDNEVTLNTNGNEATVRCSSLKSIFDEVRARDIPGLGATQTASDLVSVIRDHTDGAGNFVFREFITSTAWSIQTTTTNYNFATTTALENLSAWGMMVKLAEAEGFVLSITRTGGISFEDRNEATSASQFSFFGQGFRNQNIIRINTYKEALDKLFTFFRVQYLSADTTTSYLTAGTTTSVDGVNLSWKYGQRVYNFKNTFFANTSAAQGVIDALFTELSGVKNELDMKCVFIPQLNILDHVDVSYQAVDETDFTLWDVAVWDTDSWPTEGQNFDFTAKSFKVLSKKHDLDNFATSFRLREV